MDNETCLWTYDEDHDVWEGTCGAAWVLNDGTPTDNEMRYCPTCGRQLVEQEQTRQELMAHYREEA